MTTTTKTMTDLHDKIHQLLNAPRPKPKKPETEQAFLQLVEELVEACEQDDASWKRLVLALLHKRYHMLAPEAKALQENDNHKKKKTAAAESTGDGERKLFYLALQKLLEAAQDGNVAAQKATKVLLELAPHVGGSRDVCFLLESMIGSAAAVDSTSLNRSLSLLVAEAVLNVERKLEEGTGVPGLAGLLDFAARQLDQDLQHTRMGDDEAVGFPSTMHVFVPHNGRGALSKAQKERLHRDTSQRQVVNAAAEILIWSRTTVATEHKAFLPSLERFRANACRAQEDEVETKAACKASLHSMQTVIRKYRQELNSYARAKGFMLAEQFALDPSKLNLSKIQKAKHGDTAKTQKLASKKRNNEVLRLIQAHFASDPSKITKYSSLTELSNGWATNVNENDEIAVLEKSIQVARVKATLKHLRSACKPLPRRLVIASIDTSCLNHLAALCVAAAMSRWEIEEGDNENETMAEQGSSVKLLLGASEQVISSFSDFTKLLDGIVSKSLKFEIDAETFMGGDGVATTKALVNLLDRHVVGDNDDFLLLTPANVSVPKDKHQAMVSKGCRMHCHNADNLGERLQREKAKAGDITISLAWDTLDDLDLHVFVPSGEEVWYSNKSASSCTACLDVDMNAGGGNTKEPVENVFVGDLDHRTEAPHGNYKVVVQNYAYHTPDRSALIPWRVCVDMNGVKQNYSGQCKGSGKSSDVVVCEFDYSGRTVPFPGDKDKAAFETSTLVGLTTSTGQTLESLVNLVKVTHQLERLDEARMLVDDPEATTATETTPNQQQEEPSRTTEVEAGVLDITNKDRTDMLLAKLPKRFQKAVAEAFGGVSLVEECASEVARRMAADKIPLSGLSKAGYPAEIVGMVKDKLAAAMAD